MSDRAQRASRALMLCALLSGIVSCVSRYTLQTPADIAVLPESRGVNGGSFVALTDWQYRGSDSGFHYFWHYHNVDNILRKSSVRITRSTVVLDAPEHGVDKAAQWVTLRGTEAATFHFVLHSVPGA